MLQLCTMILLAGPLFGPAARPSPQSELLAALNDLAAVSPEARTATRYLSLYSIESSQHAEAADVVSFVINSVSRAATLRMPEKVEASEGRLLRISLGEYGLPAESWEALASRDSYWHLRTQVIDPTQRNKQPSVREVFTDGGWIDLENAARLRTLSGSTGAILRADYFLLKATTTLDGGQYYQLAGVPEREADFLDSLGLDLDTIDRLRADEGANLLYSQVTFKLRRLVRRQGPLGGVWQTYDVNASTAERDPFRNPFSFIYDAGEYIAAKKNGLHLFALYDDRGRRQDSVPDVIAKDTSDRRGAGIIVPMISCVRCHVEDGLRPFSNDQRRLLAGHVDLLTAKAKDAERLAAFYHTNIGRRLLRDREDYAEAVANCAGGRTAAEVAESLARFISAYADSPVNAKQAARELGVLPSALSECLRASHDPVLLALVEGLEVQRQQWEASFAEAALLTHRYLTPRNQE